MSTMSRVSIHGAYAIAPKMLVESPQVSDRAIRLWLFLYLEGYKSDTDSPALLQEEMAEWLQCSESSVKRAIKELIDIRYLRVEHHKSWRGQEASEYHITTVPGHFESYELTASQGVTDDTSDGARVSPVDPTCSSPVDPSSISKDSIELAPDDAGYSFTHSDIFEAICVTFGVNMSRLTESQRKSAGKAARELRGAHATPYEIQAVFDLMLKELGERKFVTLANLVQKWGEYIDRIPGVSVDTTPVASVKLPSAEQYDQMVALAEAGEKWTDASGNEWPAKDHPMFHYPELA